MNLDQKIRQLSAILTIRIVAACNRNEETKNQQIYVQKDAVLK